MSWSLVAIGCAHPPPCNREDVQQAYDASGVKRTDATTITNACLDRIIGDLKACYKKY